MRKNRLLLVLLLALASGAVAGYSILEYLRQRPSPLIASEPRGNVVTVVVAARELPLGHMVTEEDVRLQDWPGSAAPEGYATSLGEVVGNGLISPLKPNEPVLSADLAEGRGGLAPVIPPGMRAVTIQSNEVFQVAGHAIPGTVVDLILIGESGGSKISKIIMQNLPVRGVTQNIQEDENGIPQPGSTVTVIVTPEDAEKIKLAQTEGSVHLALRNPMDLETVETRGERPSALFTGAGRATSGGTRVLSGTTAAPAESERFMIIYRNGVRTLVNY